MVTFDVDATRQALAWKPLIGALRSMFQTGCEAPVRHHHDVAVPGDSTATLLLMPAWTPGDYLGIKIANVFPGNAGRGSPAVSASYVLCDGKTGEMLAVIDGGELTARRTAAASALAASYLARPDASRLLTVGTGRLPKDLVAAHSNVRPIRKVTCWGRNFDKAVELAEQLVADGVDARATDNLALAAANADIISCATLANEPLLCGEWLNPGTHVDLVGGFKRTMREADDDVVRRASVFVDTRAGATSEAGDIVQPIESGVLSESDIQADLFDLSRGAHPGRRSEAEITMFKSVGAALEDLAAAILVYESKV